jgi:hypothetical protein
MNKDPNKYPSRFVGLVIRSFTRKIQKQLNVIELTVLSMIKTSSVNIKCKVGYFLPSITLIPSALVTRHHVICFDLNQQKQRTRQKQQ